MQVSTLSMCCQPAHRWSTTADDSAGTVLAPVMAVRFAATKCAYGGRKIAHKPAAIGQVDVVRTGLGGGLGHTIGLCLKRPRRVNHQAHAQRSQPVCQARGLVVECNALCAVVQCGGQPLGAAGITARHQQRNVMVAGRVARQAATDAGAKVAVATKDQCFEGSHRWGQMGVIGGNWG